MRFRLTAFGLHLSGSLTLLALTFGALYLGWYRWPGWYLAGALRVVGIVVLVDLVLGPTLTLIIANPNKPRRELVRDLSIIVTVQLAALAYGADTLWRGRPLYYTYSVNRLEMVSASDIEAPEVARARQQNPTLAPHWYERPRWVWAPLPDNPDEAAKIAEGTLFGGQDIIQMPRYFKPWEQGLPRLREQLLTVGEIQELSKSERAALQTRMLALGLAPERRTVLLLWGESRRVLVVFDPATLKIRAMLEP